MGKTILTSKQSDFLELAQAQATIVRNFYLTGGTALAEFYFQHRLSEDIDLFSEKEVNVSAVEAFLQTASSKLGISKIIKQNYLGLFTYILEYKQSLRSGNLKDGETLKVDFSYYPFPKIEKGAHFGKLEVSSLYDISVNKIQAIATRTKARDYIDLYFIFKDSKHPAYEYLKKLRLDSQAKFDWPLEAKNLVAAFLKVKDLKKDDFPKMLVTFNIDDFEKFFLKLAKSLESGIFK